jgi:hypothetical protein
VPEGSGLLLFVLGAEVLVSALATTGCAYRVPGIAAHAYLDIQESCFGFRKSCHGGTPLLGLLLNVILPLNGFVPDPPFL